jgi:hypothetical protein
MRQTQSYAAGPSLLWSRMAKCRLSCAAPQGWLGRRLSSTRARIIRSRPNHWEGEVPARPVATHATRGSPRFLGNISQLAESPLPPVDQWLTFWGPRPGGRQVLGSPSLGGRTSGGRRTYGLRDKHFGGDNLQVPIFEGKLKNGLRKQPFLSVGKIYIIPTGQSAGCEGLK